MYLMISSFLEIRLEFKYSFETYNNYPEKYIYMSSYVHNVFISKVNY